MSSHLMSGAQLERRWWLVDQQCHLHLGPKYLILQHTKCKCQHKCGQTEHSLSCQLYYQTGSRRESTTKICLQFEISKEMLDQIDKEFKAWVKKSEK